MKKQSLGQSVRCKRPLRLTQSLLNPRSLNLSSQSKFERTSSDEFCQENKTQDSENDQSKTFSTKDQKSLKIIKQETNINQNHDVHKNRITRHKSNNTYTHNLRNKHSHIVICKYPSSKEFNKIPLPEIPKNQSSSNVSSHVSRTKTQTFNRNFKTRLNQVNQARSTCRQLDRVTANTNGNNTYVSSTVRTNLGSDLYLDRLSPTLINWKSKSERKTKDKSNANNTRNDKSISSRQLIRSKSTAVGNSNLLKSERINNRISNLKLVGMVIHNCIILFEKNHAKNKIIYAFQIYDEAELQMFSIFRKQYLLV